MLSVFERLFEEFGLAHYVQAFEQLIWPAIRLSTEFVEDEAQIAVGATKIGGRPDLSDHIVWPKRNGARLSFLAQINLFEVVQFGAAAPLPKEGMLYFFYDAAEQPWGFDPAHADGSRVIYCSSAGLRQREFPPSLAEDCCFDPCRVTFAECLTLPPWWSRLLEPLGMADEEQDRYRQMLERINEVRPDEALHQLLGHPAAIQMDMQTECQLVSNGLYCGDQSGFADPRANEVGRGAERWRLLLQLDSDDQPEMLWGDHGRLYFWIDERDLSNMRFEKTWTILQCE